jgi:hypothetical protein
VEQQVLVEVEQEHLMVVLLEQQELLILEEDQVDGVNHQYKLVLEVQESLL